MRSIYILFISLLVSFSCFAKKQYVFEPKYQVNNTSSFSDTIYISISDDRVFTDKVKEKFTSEQLIDTIFNIVNKAFPNCVILRESDSETNVNKITFRIHIETYQVEFNRKIKAQDLVITPLITGGSSRWVGTTDYKVEILERDRNNQEKTNTISFHGEDSGKNWKGTSSAKKVLSNAFKQATDALINTLIILSSK